MTYSSDPFGQGSHFKMLWKVFTEKSTYVSKQRHWIL